MSVEIIYLDRFAYTMYGVFGMLRYDGMKLFTVERPWSDNQRNVSCIPTGAYPLQLSKHYGDDGEADDYATYLVCDVPGRSLFKFDIANTMDEIEGCIALGTGLGWMNPRGVGHKWAVTDSRDALERFMEHMNGVPEAVLCVRNIMEGA